MAKHIKDLEDKLAEMKETTSNQSINVNDSGGADRVNEKELLCEYCEYKCKKLVKIKKHMSTKHCNRNVK